MLSIFVDACSIMSTSCEWTLDPGAPESFNPESADRLFILQAVARRSRRLRVAQRHEAGRAVGRRDVRSIGHYGTSFLVNSPMCSSAAAVNNGFHRRRERSCQSSPRRPTYNLH